MALAEDIINGTYDSNNYFNSNGKKKKKRTELADDIINGTYNPEDYFSISKNESSYSTESNPITIREKFTSSDEYRELSEKASNPMAHPMIKDLKKKMDNTINEYGDRPFNDETIKEMNEKDGTWFKSSEALKDGLSLSGLFKTGISTVADAGVNVVEGFLGGVEGLTDWLQYRYADYNRAWGNDEWANAIEKNAKTNSTRILLGDDSYGSIEEFFDKNSILGEKSDSVANGVGQLLEQAGMYGLTGPAGAPGKALEYGSIYASAAGSGQSSSYELMDQRIEELEYLKNNTTNKQEQEKYQNQIDKIKENYDAYAKKYGILTGLSESASEALFGGIGKVLNVRGLSNGTGIDEQLSKYLSSKVDNIIFKNAIELGITGLAEGTEEVVSDFGQAIAEKLTYKSDEDLLKLLQDQDYLEDFIVGSMTAWVGSTPKTYSATKNNRELSTNYTKNERQVLDSIEKNKTSDLQKEKTIEIETNKSINELEQQQNGGLSQKEKDAIRKDIQQKVESGEIDITTQKLSKKEISKIKEEIENNMLEGNLNIEDIENALTSQESAQIRELEERMDTISSQQEKTQIEAQIRKLQNDKFFKLKESLKNDYNLQRTYYEANQRNVKFEYDSSEINDNQKFTYESASKYFDNTTKSHQFVEKVANLSSAAGTNYGFINNEELKKLGHDIEGKQVNGLVRTSKDGNSTILINVDSEKALNTIVGHETTHLLEGTKEYQDLQSAIFEYAKSKKDYQQRLDNLNELYDGVENADVNNELTADLVGDYLFTDEQFIDSLTSKPTLLGKIKNLIDSLVVKFKGTSEEKQLIEIQKKFQKAYKNIDTNLELDSTKYHLSDNALNDINNLLIGKYDTSQDIKLRDYTPKQLVDVGILDNPMLMNSKHILSNVLSSSEAKLRNIYDKDANYHELGVKTFLETIDSLDNPEKIFKNVNGKDYIILTRKYDKNNLKIITPIYIETKGNYNKVELDTNKIKSIYGKDKLNEYIKRNLKNGSLEIVYDAKKRESTTGSQSSNDTNSFSKDNVPQNDNKVNSSNTLSTTNNTQNNTKYSLASKGLDNSSFILPLERRVSGDALLDAQDFIEEIKDVGAEVDENGYVTAYHQTTIDNARKIRETGKMISNERDIFFSTSINAQQSDGRGTEKLKFKIPAEELILDDLFSDNADVKIPLNNKQSVDISKYLVDDDNSFYLTNSDNKPIDISNLEETSYMRQFTFNRKYDKQNISAYRGESDSTGTNPAFYGLGLYTTLDKKYASQYGDVQKVDSSLLPDNPLHFKTQNDFKIWEQELAKQLGIKKSALYSSEYGVEQYIQKLGYDGLMIGTGKDVDLISFVNSPIKWQSNIQENYSLSTINEDIAPIKGDYQIYGEDIKYQEKPQIELQEYTPKLNLPVEMISSVNESTKKEYTNNYSPLEKERINKSTIDSKIERAIQKESFKAINMATKTATQLADFTRKEKNQFREDLKKFYGKTRSELANVDTYREIEDIISKFANKEYDFIDYQVDHIKSEIANKMIKISHDLKYQVGDFVYFQKSNYGKLNFSDDGVDLQSLWRELSYDYPQYFSEDIKTEGEILFSLNEFVNQESAITEKYRLTTGDLSKIRDKVFNQLVNNSMDDISINELQSELEAKANVRTRKIIQQELLDDMGITMNDLQIGKDINSIDLSRTDPIRANEKIFGWKIGKKINDATVNRVKHNEAEATRWKNQERDEIKALGIKPRSAESAAVQKYGEKQYLDKFGDYKKYGDRELEIEFPDVDTQNRIKRAASIIKGKYEVYIDQINAVLTDMGYDAIPKRKDYMRHFYEIDDKLSQWGVPFNRNDMNSDVLPTDINGITDEFKPGKNWFASAMKRTGMKTTYDAITGIDGYLDSAANLIFHTEDIQRYRSLSKLVRETYGKEHGLDNIDLMSDIEVEQRLEDITSNKLSKYAAWLDEQANALAGKKGKIDRGLEEIAGRRVYNALNTLKSQVGSNMTGFNVRSSLTNFASAIQGLSKVNKFSALQGTVSTLRNIVHDDGLIYKSDFLTNRFGSDNLSKKTWQKVSAAGQIFMSGSDYFTANQIWRSKYYEGINNGLSEDVAISEADDFSARVMGDRTKGTTATIFNSKTLGLFTQFQLEVNNQWSNLVHDNKMEIKSGKRTGTAILFQLGQLFVASHLFNKLFTNITGSSVMLDPIQMLMDMFNPDDDDEEKTIIERAEGVVDDFLDNVPFVSTFTGGRIPISSALPIKEFVKGEDQYGNKKDRMNILLEALPYYVLPTGYSQLQKTHNGLSMFDDELPVKGAYTKGGDLKYPVEDNFGNRLQAGLFGKSANKNARDYYDNGRSPLKPKQIQEYKDLDMTIQEYWDYREGLANARKTEDENGYTKYLDSNGNIYWYDKDEQVVYDSNYKQKDISITSLEKASTMEQLYDYITGLNNVTTNQKEIMFNNVTSKSNTDQYGYQKYTNKEVSKNGKTVTKTYWYDEKNDILYNSDYEKVDKTKNGMTKVSDKISLEKYDKYANYEEFDFATKNADKYDFLQENNISFKDYNASEESKDAYNWAYNNKDKYIVSKAVTNDLVAYKKYTKELNEIKGDINSKGKTVSGSRQKKVVNYINDLDIDYGSKLILYKLEYSSDKKSNSKIVDYLNSRDDISYQEMVTILEELDMKVDNKGNVRW